MPRRCFSVLFLLLALAFNASAGSKPKLKLAEDGFPTGQNTPEGAASDFVRAMAQGDTSLLTKVCLRPFGDGQARSDYTGYLSSLVSQIEEQKEKREQAGDPPARIARVYAARSLSSTGPASYAHAMFDFQDVKFVDVDVLLGGSKHHLRRTLVIEDRGKWYVHPAPSISPLLSDGLVDETPSEQSVSDVYQVAN